MSLRALSSLLIRRFSPRRTPVALAETIGSASASASGRPTRSLHSLSNPDAAVGALGALSVTGLLAALVGFLYLKKDDKAADEGASNAVVTDTWGAALNDPGIIRMFTDKDGNIAWMEYYEYLVFHMHYLDRKKRYEAITRSEVPKVDEAVMKRWYEESTKKLNESYKNHRKMVMEQEYKVDEAAMKKRFEDWMKEYGRTYKDDEEKARRYEVFKVNAIRADKLNTHSRGARFAPNNHGDWTEDERRMLDCRQGDMDFKSFIEDLKTMYAEKGRFDAHRRQVAPQEQTEAVKKRFKQLAVRKAEQERQANKH